jgi:putative peptidoglycan lipid II flippase
VSEPSVPVTEPTRGPWRQYGRDIGRAAALIGVITAVARVVGFGRQLVFAHTVGSTCLGTAYATANQVPNIIYDIVLGGALTSAVVPVLAGAAARRGDNGGGAQRRAGASGAVAADSSPAAGAGGGRAADAGASGAVAADSSPAAGAGGGRAADAGASPAADARGSPAADARGSPAADAGASRAADAEASQVASALLTWTLLLLVPASAVIGLLARPLTSLLLAGSPHCHAAAATAVSSGMLAVFAPQIVLYGLAVVLYGILQAHRRFLAPALAPVVSSLVVIAAYIGFVPLGRGYQNRLAELPLPAEVMLSAGTTVGVAALVLTALVPALRLRLALRPALRFPMGVARQVRGLAAVGVASLVAQDAAVVAVIVLANGHGGRGALVLYNFGWQVFFVPYAVLAVPIATSAFPVLSAASGPEFDQTAASSTRAIMLASWLGASLLAGAAVPAARLFVSHPGHAHQLAITFAVFAPGLAGYGLTAALSRVLLACRRSRVAAIALAGGWLVVIAVDVAAVPLVPAFWVVPVLAMANTTGLTCAAVILLGAVRAVRSGAALRGSARAAGAGLAGALAGAGAGALVSAAFPVTGFIPNALVGVLACATAALAFWGCVLALDGRDLRAMAARIAGRIAR